MIQKYTAATLTLAAAGTAVAQGFDNPLLIT